MIYVIVKLSFEGFHCWPDAPDHAAFLRNRHRHIFHVTAAKRVSHGDREVEIITLKQEMLAHIGQYDGEFDTMSCEHIAQMLLTRFGLSQCAVLEDDENGAYVTAGPGQQPVEGY